MMEALLVDLGARQLIKNAEVKKAAYVANDLLDEILYEHLHRKQDIKERYYKKDRLRARHFFFMCMSNQLGFQWRMAHKVREVMALIDDVFNEARRYGIQPINVGQAALNDGGSLRPLSALDPELQQCRELPDARQFIGRKSDEAELVEALCSSFSPSEDLLFIAIVGIGVCDSVKNSIVHSLEGLASEDSRAFFEQTVFANEEKCPSSLEEYIISKDNLISLWMAQGLLCREEGSTLKMEEIEVPNVARELKHLRYFDVLDNPIKELPESITTLYHLTCKTLNLLGCSQLDKLPKGLSRLVNLRHLHAGSLVEMPTGIERLTCLQTLPPIRSSASGGTSGLGELGCLPDVKGNVQVSGLEHVKSKEEAQKAGFGRKTAGFPGKELKAA
ncbi:putative disease resistance protein, partial [Drosera capensis]